jgi:hypothetical protein
MLDAVSLDQITESHLFSLIDNAVAESRMLPKAEC